jgi:hypothetical protein
MKKLFLTISVLSALTFTAAAQADRKPAPTTAAEAQSPEERATNETAKASASLGLNDNQKAKFKQFALDRATANKPLREKGKASTNKAEKQTIHSQLKANNEKFFSSVNAILTPEQQTKWAEHRKKMEAKQAKNKEAQHD